MKDLLKALKILAESTPENYTAQLESNGKGDSYALRARIYDTNTGKEYFYLNIDGHENFYIVENGVMTKVKSNDLFS